MLSANYSSWLHNLQVVYNDSKGLHEYRDLWKNLTDQLDFEKSLNYNGTSISNILQPTLTLVAVNASAMSFSVRAHAENLSAFGSANDFWREHEFKLDLKFCDLNEDLKKVCLHLVQDH